MPSFAFALLAIICMFRQSLSQSNISKCEIDLGNMVRLTQSSDFRMIDSWGKIPSGILEYNVNALGSFSECQRIDNAHFCMLNSIDENSFPVPFLMGLGEYLNTSIPLTTLGVCVPNSCHSYNVVDSLFSVQKRIKLPFQLESKPIAHCFESNSVSKDSGALFLVVVFSTFLVIGISLSLVDVLARYDLSPNGLKKIMTYPRSESVSQDFSYKYLVYHEGDSDGQESQESQPEEDTYNSFLKYVNVFSAYRNMKHLFSTESKESEDGDNLGVLDGIRVISILWVILGHTYFWSISSPFQNMPSMTEKFNNFSFLIVLNAFFSVDTFFVLSGFLLSLLLLKKLDKAGSENILKTSDLWKACLHRYLRITPVYLLVILFYGVLASYSGSGPLWYKLDHVHELCQSNWWRNILYIDDFWDVGDSCLSWGWYLSNDMQFFVLSISIIWVLRRNKILGHSLFAVVLFGSVISCIILALKYDLKAFWVAPLLDILKGNIPSDINEVSDTTKYIYYKPWARVQAYLVGVYGGLFHAKMRWYIRKLETWKVLVLILSSLCLMALSVFGVHSEQEGHPSSTFADVMYISFSRISWAVGVQTILSLAINNRTGIIGDFLSLTAWKPFARVGLLSYLLHPIVLDMLYYTIEAPIVYSDSLFVHYFVSTSVLTYALAFIGSIFIEAPLRNMLK